VIAEILPPLAVACEAFSDCAQARLFPEEESIVACAVQSRRLAFATARACARRALAGLGCEPVAIPRDERGAPLWPAGVVGSITHCAGYRACAVARARDVITLGIDAEPADALPGRVLERISSAPERTGLCALAAAHPTVCWDRLLFSAKEAVYKAWYPLTGRWLDFGDAVITFDPAGTFAAELLVPGPLLAGRPLGSFAGRWLTGDGLVLTAVALLA
jgi:4'-phosphopantetheinyl transferase EntD